MLREPGLDRADLNVARMQNYGPKGALLSDIHYWDWQPAGDPTAASTSSFPRQLRIDRPHDDYRIELQITKLTLNEDLPTDRFQLAQPPNSELVRVGEENGSAAPKDSKP